MRTNKTLAQLDPAITISPALLECRCNYQLLGVCMCLCVSPFACIICKSVRVTTGVHTEEPLISG